MLGDFDLVDLGRVDRESLFDADAGSDPAHGERLADAAALLFQDKSFKDLNPFARAFLDLDMYFQRIANFKSRHIFP